MKKIKVCLAWHSLTSTNYGVSALTIAHMQMLHEAADIAGVKLDIYTIGTPQNISLLMGLHEPFPASYTFKHYTVSTKILLKDYFTTAEVCKELKDTDFIFDIGEGDSYSDIYGFKRLANLITTKLFARYFQIKQVIAPQTIGPFKYKLSQLVALGVLRGSHRVYTRDAPSLSLLEEAGISATQIADVAFSLDYDKATTKIQGAIGINVSGLLWSGGYSGDNQFSLKLNYKLFVRELIDFFLEHRLAVHLIAHVIDDNNEREDDYRACREIKNEYIGNDSIVAAPKFNGAIEAKSYIARMEFFIGSRMHATIAALSTGLPTVPVAYSRKFAGVFNGISYPHVIDAKACTTEQAITAVKSKYLQELSSLRSNSQSSKEIAIKSNRLYLNELVNMFKNEQSTEKN